MRILKPINKHIYELTPANKKNIYKMLGVKNQTALLKTKYKHQHPVKKINHRDFQWKMAVAQYNNQIKTVNAKTLVARKESKVAINPTNKSRAKVYKDVKSLAKKLQINVESYKKQYRQSTTGYWNNELLKLQVHYEPLVRVQKKTNIYGGDLKMIAFTNVYDSMRDDTLKVHLRKHSVPKGRQIALATQNVKKIENQLQFIMKQHLPKRIKNKDNIRRQLHASLNRRLKRDTPDGLMYRLHVEDGNGKHLSTPVMKNPYKTLQHLMTTHIVPKSKSYQGSDFVIRSISFSTIKSSLMCGYTRSIKVAHEKWHVFDPSGARTSCIYQSIAISRNWLLNPKLLDNHPALAQSAKKT